MTARAVSPPPAIESTSTDGLRLLRDAVHRHSATPPAPFFLLFAGVLVAPVLLAGVAGVRVAPVPIIIPPPRWFRTLRPPIQLEVLKHPPSSKRTLRWPLPRIPLPPALILKRKYSEVVSNSPPPAPPTGANTNHRPSSAAVPDSPLPARGPPSIPPLIMPSIRIMGD